MQKFHVFQGWSQSGEGWIWDGEPGAIVSPRPNTRARGVDVDGDLWLCVEVAIVPTKMPWYWRPDRGLVLSLEKRGFSCHGEGWAAGRYWSSRYDLDDIRRLSPFLTAEDVASLRQEYRRRNEARRQRANLDKPQKGSPHGRMLDVDDGELRPRKRKPGPGRGGKDGVKRMTPAERTMRQAEARRRWREKNLERELERQRQRRQERSPGHQQNISGGQMRDSDT